MEWSHEGLRITDDATRIDLDVVHGFLADTYWSPGVPREVVARAIRHSLCLTALDGDQQVGFARIVTDRATFAWLCDVFVLPGWRGRGIGRALARAAVEHPDTAEVRRFLLATLDAHGLYTSLGFTPVADPERLMVVHRDPSVLYGS